MPEIVQIGPFRPQLVEPEKFTLTVENNKIIDADIELGYVHRGIEKLFTTKTYLQNLALAERICGICSGIHTLAYAQTAEGVIDVQVPDRARYLRTIYMEIERLHSHYLWFGVLAHSLHDTEAFLKIMGEREKVQDLLEFLTGNRMNYLINTIGGVRRDLNEKKIQRIRSVLKDMKPLSDHIMTLLDDNGRFTKKTKGVGILRKERALAVGAVGPVLRGSGIKSDVRKDDPYAAYGELDWEVITEKDCDVRAKSLVRARETYESMKMINQAIDNLPKGDIVGELGDPLVTESVGRVEAPRGELFYYIKSNGTNIPERVKVRTPSFANDFTIIEMMRGDYLQNARLIIESIDPCFACTDRVTIINAKTGRKRLVKLE
ncbi:MAG: nickel-dependent hydrogenase large subunit [Candidatus Bathyarchaeia archaeon]